MNRSFRRIGPGSRRLAARIALAACAAALGVACLLAWPAPAAAETPIPPFPADGVALGDVPDRFQELRGFLARHRSRSGARYHVCVVEFTHPRDLSGSDVASGARYSERVLAAWRARLDPARSVLIVASTENRNVSLIAGSDWQALGLAGAELSTLVDRSRYEERVRAGDLPGAIRALIYATDDRIDGLVHERTEREEAERAAREAEGPGGPADPATRAAEERRRRDEEAAREAAERRRREEEAAAARRKSEQRARADAELEALRRDLERVFPAAGGAPDGAALDLVLARVRPAIRAIQPTVAGADEARLRLESEVAKARAALSRDDPADALAHLEPARGALADLDRLLAARRAGTPRAEASPAGARPDAQSVPRPAETGTGAPAPRRDALSLEPEPPAVAVGERARREPATTRPFAMGAIGLLIVAVLGALLLVVRLLHHQGAAHEAIHAFENGIRQLGLQFDGIRGRCPRTFGVEDPTRRYEGRTAEAYVGLAAAVDTAYFGYVAARRLAAVARSAVATDGPLALQGTRRVPALLSTEPVDVSGDVHDTAPPPGYEDGPPPIAPHHAWFPLKVGLTVPAADLAVRIGAIAAEAGSRAAALERALGETEGKLAEARARADACGAAAAALAARGLRVDAFEAERTRLQADHAALAARAGRDPLGTFEGLDGVRTAADALAARLAHIAATLDILDAALERGLAPCLSDVAARRAEGHGLREPRLDPEARAEAARKLAVEARAAAARGDEKEARAIASRVREAVAELARLVAASAAARTATPGRLAAQREKGPYDRTEGEQRRKALRERHAPRALETIEADLEAAAAALDAADRTCTEAEAASGRGHDLEAAALLDENDLRLTKVARLHERVDRYADELDQKRERAAEAVESAGSDLEDLETLLTDGYEGSPAVRAAIEKVRSELEPERGRQADARPDWPLRCRAATALAEAADGALASARRERATLLSARPKLDELPGLLAGAAKDVKTTLDALRADHAEAAIAAAAAAAGEAEREAAQGEAALSAAATATRERRYDDLPPSVERAEAAVARVRDLHARMRAEGEELARLRAAAREGLEAAKASIEAYEELVRGGDAFATEAVFRGFVRLRERFDRERGHQAGPRPNWRDADRAAGELGREAAPLLARARGEKESWRKTLALLPDVERARDEARPVVRSSKVRREAQDLLRQGEVEMDAAEQQRRSGRPDWGSVLDRVQRAARLIASAREHADTDIRAADQVDAVIRQAESEVKAAGGAAGGADGSGAGAQHARAEIEKAKAMMRAEQYEEALRHAREAHRAAAGAAATATIGAGARRA